MIKTIHLLMGGLELTKRERRRMRKAERQLELVGEAKPELKEKPRRSKKVDIKPRNFRQRRLLAALRNEDNAIVFATGPAGTGKTLLATLYAIQSLQEKTIRKIVIARPAVSVEEQHGFLPGDINDKMMPWLLPILDIFEEHYHPEQVKQMIKDKVIEVAPLAYMRGRTFKDCIVILDEAQNTTPSQMKMMTTRIGDNCRLFVTGDGDQYDRGYSTNGLDDFTDRVQRLGSDSIAVIKFGGGDVERAPIVSEVLSLYEEED